MLQRHRLPGGERTGPVPLWMSYQQRLAQRLRIGFKYLGERNMVDVSSNSLVELQLFLDALGRIEDRVTTAINVYDAAGADAYLKIIMIDNSRHNIDDDVENVPLVGDVWWY